MNVITSSRAISIYRKVFNSSIQIGLSATVERPDGKEEIIYELLGEKVYEGQISDMVSNVLAPYDVMCVQVPLSEEDQIKYKDARSIYTGFIKKNQNYDVRSRWLARIH